MQEYVRSSDRDRQKLYTTFPAAPAEAEKLPEAILIADAQKLEDTKKKLISFNHNFFHSEQVFLWYIPEMLESAFREAGSTAVPEALKQYYLNYFAEKSKAISFEMVGAQDEASVVPI